MLHTGKITVYCIFRHVLILKDIFTGTGVLLIQTEAILRLYCQLIYAVCV